MCVPGNIGHIHTASTQSCGLLFWSQLTLTCTMEADVGDSCENSTQPLTEVTTSINSDAC